MNRLSPLYISFSLLLASCATQPAADLQSRWDNIVYQGLDSEIAALELDNAKDCGFFDLTSLAPKARNKKLEAILHCAYKAQADGAPFKLGYTWLPLDSKVSQIILSQPQGYWVRTVDIMLDGSSADVITQKCETVVPDFESLDMELRDCFPLK